MYFVKSSDVLISAKVLHLSQVRHPNFFLTLLITESKNRQTTVAANPRKEKKAIKANPVTTCKINPNARTPNEP